MRIISSKIRISLTFGVVLLGLIWTSVAYADSLVVNTSDDLDDGQCNTTHCSLREAITAANNNPGADTISFDLSGPGPHTIVLSSPLPALSDGGTTIDGQSQAGYAGTPLIMLQPGYPPVDAAQLIGGITLASNGNVVRGISLTGFGVTNLSLSCGSPQSAGGAIVFQSGTGNTIEANYIGLTPAGLGSGNTLGIFTHPNAPGQTISGNVISANKCGISIWGDTQVIQSNLIGTDPSGTTAIGNTQTGIYVASNNNQIGSPGAGNLISGQDSYQYATGILLSTAWNVDANNVMQANKIGTDITGTAPIPNGRGIFYIDGDRGIVGGSDPSEGNIIAFNLGYGVEMEGSNHYVIYNEIFNNGTYGVETQGGTYISRNSIYDNGSLGIYTPPSAQAPPVLDPMTNAGSISGQAPCVFCVVEIYLAAPDPSGGGEGKESLGMADVTLQEIFYHELPIGLKSCDRLTATITNHANQTSAFAQNVVVPPCLQLGRIPWILISAIPIFIGPIFSILIGRQRGRSPRSSAVRGLFLGGLGGLVLLGGFWLLPFVEVGSMTPTNLPQDPGPSEDESDQVDRPLTPSPAEGTDLPITVTSTSTFTTTPTVTPTEELGECTFEAAVNLFCRLGSDTRFEAIDSFTPGQTAPVVGMSMDTYYWYVLGPLSGQLCTVPSAERYGSVSGDCAALPQFTPMPTPVDSPTPTETPTITPTFFRAGG